MWQLPPTVTSVGGGERHFQRRGNPHQDGHPEGAHHRDHWAKSGQTSGHRLPLFFFTKSLTYKAYILVISETHGEIIDCHEPGHLYFCFESTTAH